MAKYIPKEFSPNIYSAWFRIFETLSSEERSELLLAISGYPDYEPKIPIALWPFFKCELDRQFEKFMARNKQQKENRNRSTLSDERRPSSTDVDHGRPNENMVDQNANNNNNNNNNREHKTKNKEQETQTKPTGFFTETQTEPNHNPNETLTNNQITNNQITNNRDKKEVQEKPASRKSDDFRDPLVEKIISVYRETTTGYFSQIQALPDKRKRAVKKFIDFYRKQVNAVDEAAFLSAVREYFCRAVRSPFLTGQNERGWRADFDFLMNETKALALLEGKYDGHTQAPASRPNIFTVPSSQRRMQIAQAENYEPDFDLDSFGVAK